MPDVIERQIIIRSLGSGFTVTIDPPVDGDDLDGTFDAHKNARGWAGGIRMTRGWKIVDETEVAHG